MSRILVVDHRSREPQTRVKSFFHCVVVAAVRAFEYRKPPGLNEMDERRPTNRLPCLDVNVLAVVAGAQRINADFRLHIALLAGMPILVGTRLAVNASRMVAPPIEAQL